MSRTISISALYIYPVKSLAGIALHQSELDAMGLKYDRRWMLVTEQGDFLSQRKFPNMAIIQSSFRNEQLVLSCSDHDDLAVPEADPGNTMQVKIWNDTVTAQRVGDEADVWLTDILGNSCHLVYIDDDEVRQCDPDYANHSDRTGFADTFPILMISEASLEDLNQRLDKSISMKRFRPNIVIKGCEAFAEDDFKQFKIADIPIRGVKNCSRCVIPTINPETGEKDSPETLTTLMQYRKRDNNVYFGQNIAHDEPGMIQVGDTLTF